MVDTILSINNFDGSIGSTTLPSKCPCKRSFYLKNKKIKLFSFWRRNSLPEDNQVKYQPFEDDVMRKLIQMEENIFQHLLIVDL
jgi:hypothetical protein